MRHSYKNKHVQMLATFKITLRSKQKTVSPRLFAPAFTMEGGPGLYLSTYMLFRDKLFQDNAEFDSMVARCYVGSTVRPPDVQARWIIVLAVLCKISRA